MLLARLTKGEVSLEGRVGGRVVEVAMMGVVVLFCQGSCYVFSFRFVQVSFSVSYNLDIDRQINTAPVNW